MVIIKCSCKSVWLYRYSSHELVTKY